jgi:hypothetical protein
MPTLQRSFIPFLRIRSRAERHPAWENFAAMGLHRTLFWYGSAMAKPGRNAIKAGLAVAALGGGAVAAVLLLRPSPPAPVAPPSPVATVQAPDAVPTLIEKLPLPPPTLAREALLTAANAAASAYAAAAPAPVANAALVGRAFTVHLPFGCAAEANPVATWAFNAQRKTVNFEAQPVLWGETPWVRALAGETPFEAAEGFWIRRPWTASKTCPPPPPEGTDPAAAASPETLGLAQFFAPGAPRARQRGTRPYRFTRKYDGPDTPPPHAYRLALSGRITSFADGQPIRCWSESAWARPRCLIAVELTRVAFEDPATGDTLAEWRD